MHNNLWFTDFNKEYTGSEPIFYPTESISASKDLELLFPQLKKELNILWENNEDKEKYEFGNYDAFDDKQYPRGSWKKLAIKVWGINNYAALEKFPVLARYVNDHPEITSCFITRTSPGSVIKPHSGETNAIYRIHLGLKIPETNPPQCGMQVNGKTINWVNGKVITFLDAHPHHVWNNSSEYRYLVIVDVLRQEFRNRKYFIFSRIIASQLYFMAMSRVFNEKLLSRTPSYFLNILAYIIYIPTLIGIKLNTCFKLYRT